MATTGILLRRGLRADLENDPPVLGEGELVYATDTGEHGWYDQPNSVLKWATLGSGGGTTWENYSVILSSGGEASSEMIMSYTHNVVETTIMYNIASQLQDMVTGYQTNQYSGAIVVPSNMVDADILSPGILSGTTPSGLAVTTSDVNSQNIEIRKVAGEIQFWVSGNGAIADIWHSANIAIVNSTTGIIFR